MKKDGIIIVGAGILQLEAMRQARAEGLYVIATDGNPLAPGARVCDEFRQLDTYNLAGHVALVGDLRLQLPGVTIRGAMTCGADVAATVAATAEAIGSPGIPVAVATLTQDKARVRQALTEFGMSQVQPRYIIAEPNAATTQVMACMSGWGSGVVIKPLRQRASRGVTLLDPDASEDTITRALLRVSEHLYNGHFLIEERLHGAELSCEMILTDKVRRTHEPAVETPEPQVLFFNIVDRVFDYTGGNAMEAGHINPSRIAPTLWKTCEEIVYRAAQACGVYWGPFKCDMLLDMTGPHVLECTARLSGGFDCQATTPLSQGRSPVRALVQLSTGRPVPREVVEYRSRFKDGRLTVFSACAAAFPPPGVVRAAPTPAMIEEVLTYPSVKEVHCIAKQGATVEPYVHCAQRPAFVITQALTYDAAWQDARRAADVLSHFYVTEEVGT